MADSNGASTTPERKGATQTSYIVFRQGVEGDAETWTMLGTFDAANQGAAKRAAAATLTIGEGETFTLAAVSANSWKPVTGKLHIPEPKMVLS